MKTAVAAASGSSSGSAWGPDSATYLKGRNTVEELRRTKSLLDASKDRVSILRGDLEIKDRRIEELDQYKHESLITNQEQLEKISQLEGEITGLREEIALLQSGPDINEVNVQEIERLKEQIATLNRDITEQVDELIKNKPTEELGIDDRTFISVLKTSEEAFYFKLASIYQITLSRVEQIAKEKKQKLNHQVKMIIKMMRVDECLYCNTSTLQEGSKTVYSSTILPV